MVSILCHVLMIASLILIGCDLIDFCIGHYFRAPKFEAPKFEAPPTQARIIGIIGRNSEADSIVDSVLSRASFDFGDDTAVRVTDRILSKHGF